MSFTMLSAILAVSGLACTSQSGDDFGGGGSSTTSGTIDSGHGGDSGQAGGDDTGDWPSPLDEEGPSIRDVACIFDDYPNIGDVIACDMEIYDPQDDIVNGTLNLTIIGGQFDANTGTGAFDIGDYETSACTVCLFEGELSFAISDGINVSETYSLNWVVKDQGGNRSNEIDETVGG